MPSIMGAAAAPLTSAAIAEAQASLAKIRIGAWCGLSVVVWELITHSPQELKMWMGRKTPATVSFLIARWSGVMVLVTGLVNLNGHGYNCQAMHFFVYFFYASMSAAVSYVFCCRVLALYHMDRRMLIGMNIAFAMVLGAWIATLAGLRAVPNPTPVTGSSCVNKDPKWFILGWAASVAFDFLVLFATIYKIYHVQIRGEVLEYVRKSSIIYFASILACNSSLLVTNFVFSSAGYGRVMPIPVTCAFQVVVVSRLTFGLQGRGNGRTVGTSGSANVSSDVPAAPSSRRTTLRGLPLKGFGTRSQNGRTNPSGIRYQTTVVTTTSPIDNNGDASIPSTPNTALTPPPQSYLPGNVAHELGLPTTQNAFSSSVTWSPDPEKGSI